MKKINLLIATLILASLAIVTSCKKDKTPPTITFKGGTGYTSSDITIDQGATLTFGITAQSGSSKLQELKIVATSNNTPQTLLDSTFSADTFSNDFSIMFSSVGQSRLTFTITDKDGQTAEVALVVTSVEAISTYTQKILGSYGNLTIGSSFASADGTVYKMADALTNASKIDWLYFYGNSDLATLAAPDDADAATIFTGTNGLANWAVRNSTRFRLVSEGAVWDNILLSSDIAAIATGTTATSVMQLAVGDIVAFKTAGNKLGVLKVSDISGTSAGTITYDVKVQK